MGAWGTGVLDDDGAADWMDELGGAPASARPALAAALVVAWATDRVDVPAEHHELARSLVAAAPGVVPLALATCDRVTSSEDEEWWRLWEESGLLDEVLAAALAVRDAFATSGASTAP